MGKQINFYTVQLKKEREITYNLESKRIGSPEDAVNMMNDILQMKDLTKQHFVIVTLNNKNSILGIHVVHIGTLDQNVVHPRDIYQQAILNNAARIIAFHNRPSGDTTPSDKDIEITKRLKEAGNILEIQLLDHILIGDDYTSLKEKGKL